MPDFRLTNNGYVNADLDNGTLIPIFKALVGLNKDTYLDFDIVFKGDAAESILRYANRLTGKAFDAFLIANFDNGRGPLSSLVRCIVHYLNGQCGHQSVLTAISIEENKVKADHYVDQTPRTRSGSCEPLLKEGYTLSDYDLYRLMAGISPTNVCRIMLLLGGHDYHV